MAAPLKQNRELSDKVRKLAMTEYVLAIEDIEHKVYSKDFRNQLLLKLAGTVLPRINEMVGEDGEILQILVKQYGDTDKGNTTSQVSG